MWNWHGLPRVLCFSAAHTSKEGPHAHLLAPHTRTLAGDPERKAQPLLPAMVQPPGIRVEE